MRDRPSDCRANNDKLKIRRLLAEGKVLNLMQLIAGPSAVVLMVIRSDLGQRDLLFAPACPHHDFSFGHCQPHPLFPPRAPECSSCSIRRCSSIGCPGCQPSLLQARIVRDSPAPCRNIPPPHGGNHWASWLNTTSPLHDEALLLFFIDVCPAAMVIFGLRRYWNAEQCSPNSRTMALFDNQSSESNRENNGFGMV